MGDHIEIETLDGIIKIAVPEGTESGQLIRIKGKGIQHLERSNRGDHYIKVKIRVPKKLSREAKKKLEELKTEL